MSCTWKDGRFYPCDGFNGKTTQGFITTPNPSEEDGERFDRVFNNCKSCGADIRKPEPEIIIKRSGGTWVARYGGVDYLYMCNSKEEPMLFHFSANPEIHHSWTPSSEIELTDSIALLRPIVIDMQDESVAKERLLGVVGGIVFTDTDSLGIDKYRLATVDDLD